MQAMRPEIEAINEEMRNVSVFYLFSSICILYGIRLLSMLVVDSRHHSFITSKLHASTPVL